jgi:hypothetical protein
VLVIHRLLIATLLIVGGFVMAGPLRAPRKDFVPDQRTALAMAEPVVRNEAGEAFWDLRKPWVAEKYAGRWLVYGTANNGGPNMEVEDFTVVLDAHSGRVLVAGVYNYRRGLKQNLAALVNDKQGITVTGLQAKAIQRAWATHLKGRPLGKSMDEYAFGVEKIEAGWRVRVIDMSPGAGAADWLVTRYVVKTDGTVVSP